MTQSQSIFDRLKDRSRDLLFVGAISLCLALGVGAIDSSLEKQEALLIQAGARKVDLEKIRKQIGEGRLSPKEALFYKKIRR
jgi:hypothetical protein